MKPFQAQTFYELLEISVSATTADIHAAYQRLTQLYADDQVVLYGLIAPTSAEALRTRLREAAEVLSDDVRRDAYDVSLGLPSRLAAGAPVRAQPAPAAPAGPSRPTSTPAAVASSAAGWASYTFVAPAPIEASPSVSSWSIPLPVSLSSSTPRGAPAHAPPQSPKPTVAEPPSAPSAQIVDPALEAERVEAERRALEAQQAAAEAAARAEQQRREAEAHAAVEREVQQRAAEAEEQRLREAARLERERRETEAAEAERKETERREAERQAAARREAEAAEIERREAERAAAARREAETAAAAQATPEPGRLSDDVQVSLVPVRTPVRPVDAKPPPYEVPTGVEFNGDLLKQVRMARGLSLVQLAERTRIGVRHLENIESDKYPSLPATVYLRGMLMNLARELGLDGLRVAKSYLSFVDAHGAKAKD